MGKAVERNGEFGKEKAAQKFPENRSSKVESVRCGASGRIPVRNGRGIRMQRKRDSVCLAAA